MAKSLQDQELTCRDCNKGFPDSIDDQTHRLRKGWTHSPTRCSPCKKKYLEELPITLSRALTSNRAIANMETIADFLMPLYTSHLHPEQTRHHFISCTIQILTRMVAMILIQVAINFSASTNGGL